MTNAVSDEQSIYIISYQDVDDKSIEVEFIDVYNNENSSFYFERYYKKKNASIGVIPDGGNCRVIKIKIPRSQLNDMTQIAGIVNMMATSDGYDLKPFQQQYLQ